MFKQESDQTDFHSISGFSMFSMLGMTLATIMPIYFLDHDSTMSCLNLNAVVMAIIP